ncbi:MAG: flavin reductase family protein [Bacillota bacterium]|nr:flavin reductase family protein [Bacillota bacterium]
MTVEFTKNLEKAMENLHKRGAFLTTQNGDKVNTMTISWGNVGYEWGKPIFTVMVRQSRYTHELIENSGEFTVCVPVGDKMRKALGICGSKSGRDIDKFQAAGIALKDGKVTDTPVIANCDYNYECRIVYKQDMNPSLVSRDILNTSYADEDFHTFYFGEIVACYTEEQDV